MTDSNAEAGGARASRLKDAVRQARIDLAERTGVVVDLHDAEVARLEILNEALDPLFADIPAEVELFERGVTRGDQPRLWIDMVAHVVMGRDKRVYRFVQDTRYGRRGRPVRAGVVVSAPLRASAARSRRCRRRAARAR